jgi:hypothetical protein
MNLLDLISDYDQLQRNNLKSLFKECTCKILVPESLNLSYITNFLPNRALQTAPGNFQFLSTLIEAFQKLNVNQNLNGKYGLKKRFWVL